MRNKDTQKEIVLPEGMKVCMSDRLRRMAAFFIDWNLIWLPALLIAFWIAGSMQLETVFNVLPVLGLFFLIGAGFTLVVFRDVVCFGRSLGKRIFGLQVRDPESRQKPTARQLLLKNVFFFLHMPDAVVLLITGQTIGDRAATTLVFSKKSVEKHHEMAANRQQTADASNKKRTVMMVVLVALAAVVCFTAFLGGIQLLLNGQKDTQEYQLAYNYFVSSEAFQQLEAEESQIRMNQYSASTNFAVNGAEATKTVEIGFLVRFQSFTVVCHRENGVWEVCEECTAFD